MPMTTMRAYFFGEPGGDLDKACRAIFDNYDAQWIGSGTMLVGNGAGERDVMCDVPDEHREACAAALKKAGFRLQPTPSGEPATP